MRRSWRGIVEYIANTYTSAAEIGIGSFPDVGFALQEKGLQVFATDIKPIHYDGMKICRDDITNPDLTLYRGFELIYSIRPPLEMLPYMKLVAKEMNADMIIKPLSSEYPGGQLIHGGGVALFLWRWT